MTDEPVQMPLSGVAQFDPCVCGEDRWQMIADVDEVTMGMSLGARCAACDRRYGDRHGPR